MKLKFLVLLCLPLFIAVGCGDSEKKEALRKERTYLMEEKIEGIEDLSEEEFEELYKQKRAQDVQKLIDKNNQRAAELQSSIDKLDRKVKK